MTDAERRALKAIADRGAGNLSDGGMERKLIRTMTNFYADWCVSPGAVLQEWCDEHGMSIENAAAACRHMKLETFQDILTGHVPITPQLAGALQAGTGTLAKVWLNLERQYRESLAAGKTSS